MDRIERIRQSFVSPRLEESDTHDYITRHKRDNRKRTDDEEDHWQDHEQDLTDISIEALIIYLQGLSGHNISSEDEHKPIDPDMRQAIAAYTHEEPRPHANHHPSGHVRLSDNDVEQIERIINGLQRLLARNIDHITLIPAATFLDCVEKTVEKYQSI